jgi:hypothetical protein
VCNTLVDHVQHTAAIACLLNLTTLSSLDFSPASPSSAFGHRWLHAQIDALARVLPSLRNLQHLTMNHLRAHGASAELLCALSTLTQLTALCIHGAVLSAPLVQALATIARCGNIRSWLCRIALLGSSCGARLTPGEAAQCTRDPAQTHSGMCMCLIWSYMS